MPNKQRGETEVKLGDRTYTMRPGFQMLSELEDRFSGEGILQTIQRLQTLRYGIRDIAFIVYAGIREALGDEAPSYEWVGQKIAEQGIMSVFDKVTDMLWHVINEGPKPSKKKDRSQTEPPKTKG